MKKKNEEKRRVHRTMVQESFQLFLVIPNVHGMVRIYLRDISPLGLCFRSEVSAEFAMGQKMAMRVYISPTFYLPVDGSVVRMANGDVAIEFSETDSPAVRALGKLQEFLEAAADGAVLVE